MSDRQPTFEHVENLIRQSEKRILAEVRESFETLRTNDLAHIEKRLTYRGGGED